MKIIEQNILEVDSPAVICHQVNCMGIMGGGIALQIRERHPHVYDAYKAKTDWLLGDCQIVEISNGDSQFIANLAGQQYIGTDDMTNVDALKLALRAARDFAEANGLDLYVPYMIGCGLAGGDWNEVSEMIERTAPNAIICRYVP